MRHESKLLINVECESDQCVHVAHYNIFDTHTLGSNSTATFGPSVELITFAAISWTVSLFLVIVFAVLWRCWDYGKQFI